MPQSHQKTPETRQTASLGLLTLITATLAFINWELLFLEIDRSPIVPGHTSSLEPLPTLTTGAQAVLGPLESYPETTARPLFTASRRPPPETEEEPETEYSRPEPEDLRLVGVMQTGSSHAKALIRSGKTEGRWVVLGDEIDGWLVHRIGNEAVILQAGKAIYELKLFPRKLEPNG